MLGGLFAERAVLFENETIGIVLLVFIAVVVSLLTLGAFERNLHSRCFSSHIENSITKKLHPLTGVIVVYHI